VTKRAACALAVLLVSGGSSSARGEESGPATGPQENDPNVGLFRLPARRGANALAGPEGFGFFSTDNRFGLMFHPLLQADADGELGRLLPGEDWSTFLARYAGLALTARIYDRFRYEMLVGFSESQLLLAQAWLDFEVTPWLHLRAGKFAFPISLERVTAPFFLPLVSVDLASSLLPSVDTGAAVWGRIGDVFLYSLAVVNGATASVVGDIDPDSSKDVVGRVALTPFAIRGPELLRSLTVGVGGSGGSHRGTATSPQVLSLSTWGGVRYFGYQSGVVSTGDTLRLVPQASWHSGPVSVYGELARTYDHVAGAGVTSSAWGAVATAVLTGERAAPLHAVVPARNLDLSRGHLGALELVAGGGALDVLDQGQLAARVDPKAAMRGGRMMAWGINWYPNASLRITVDLEHTWFVPLASLPALSYETLLVGRLQVVL
jgi:phosphate-selective porin